MSELARRLPTPAEPGRLLLDQEGMRRAWTRVAHEVLERNGTDVAIVLAGIPTRGLPLASRLAEQLRQLGGRAEVLELEVAAHRDDRPGEPQILSTNSPGVGGRLVVLVDDVIFHGRTARAALDALTELGRPRAVQLAVMVDRGHRELPIRADYVGKNIPTALSDRVEVHVEEIDGRDAVMLISPAREAELWDADDHPGLEDA